MLTATIDKIGNDYCVMYVTTFSDEPIQQTLWWKIDQIERTPGAITWHPQIGDNVRRGHSGAWVGPGYRAYMNGSAEAVKVERVPVPCPKAGKKLVRWNDGRWEKLLARGWVAV